MCVYKQMILNKKYLPNKKNKGNVPECTDERFRYVEIKCGKCHECRKERARQWAVRLHEELKGCSRAEFVTLTFSDEWIDELANRYSIDVQTCDESIYNENLNKVAGKAIRLFLERYRKRWGKSLKHWFVTERGMDYTERIHIHGIVFDGNEQYLNYWQYGRVDTGEYVNGQTVNYIGKYILKRDLQHKYFTGKVFCSPGLGKYYTEGNISENVFNGVNTRDYYRFENGKKVSLPTYYRNKIYTDEQKEFLWKMKMDSGVVYVGKVKLINPTPEEVYKYTKQQRELYARLFEDSPHEWDYIRGVKNKEAFDEYKKNELARISRMCSLTKNKQLKERMIWFLEH